MIMSYLVEGFWRILMNLNVLKWY